MILTSQFTAEQKSYFLNNPVAPGHGAISNVLLLLDCTRDIVQQKERQQIGKVGIITLDEVNDAITFMETYQSALTHLPPARKEYETAAAPTGITEEQKQGLGKLCYTLAKIRGMHRELPLNVLGKADAVKKHVLNLPPLSTQTRLEILRIEDGLRNEDKAKQTARPKSTHRYKRPPGTTEIGG